MDFTLLQIILLCICFVAFIGLCLWIYWPGRRRVYTEAAHLVFDRYEKKSINLSDSSGEQRNHE